MRLPGMMFTVRGLMIAVGVSAVGLAGVVALRGADPVTAFSCLVVLPVLFSPVVVPAVMLSAPPPVAQGLFRRVGLATLAVTVPSCVWGATDGAPGQSLGVFVWGGSLWLTLAFWLGYHASRARVRWANRRR